MRQPIIDGQSIDQFIPKHLWDMFYNHPMPQYKYAVHDGYAPYSFPTEGLVMYLPLWALKGSPFKSVDAYKHTSIVTGALERPGGRLFDGNDVIAVADAPSLDMTPNMTALIWVDAPEPAGGEAIFSHFDQNSKIAWLVRNGSAGNRDKFLVQITDDGVGGAGNGKNYSSSVTVLDGSPHLVGFTFAAGTLNLYKDGVIDGSPTITQDDNITTIYVTDADVGLGARYDTVAWEDFFTGLISEAWLYNRALSASELSHIFNVTKWRYP